MVGGGNNDFIGAVHHAAALMDNRIELVCGCFSSHPDISLASGREYFLPDNRIYFSHAEMIEKESALPDGERMDFISIVTPNVTHFEPAMMALDKGFDVVIEKPMTFTLEQAKQLRQKVMQTGRTLALKIRIYGEKGGIEWRQEEPNTLLVKRTDRPTEIVRVGNGYMGAAAKANTRTPAGHPEGYIEAFANIYRNFARTVMAKRDGREPEASWLDFPGVDDGIRGMQFIETVVRSGYEQNVKWIKWIE